MNCSEFQQCVGDLTRGIEAAGAAAHAMACPRCAAELADQKALAAGLRALAAETRQEAPRHLQRVLGAVVAERGRPRTIPRWWYLVAAAAGALLLLIAGPFGKTRAPAARTPHTVPARRTPAVAPREMLAERPRTAPARNSRAPRQPAVEFEPLDYAAGLTPVEAGQVVRVALPARDPAGRTVQADVLVGEDGVARAIRLVQ
ncbi:MAG: hypothetical protein ACRD9L_27700 [Bryobacteraceae bacterium]